MRSSARSRCAVALLITLLLAGCSGCTSGSIKVTVLQADPAGPAANALVTLVGTALSANTDGAGVALFDDLAPGPYIVKTGEGLCAEQRDATVVDGVETPVLFTLCSDAIKASNALSEDFIALLDVRLPDATGSRCENDLLIQGRLGVAPLGANALALDDATSPCHGAAWILSAGRAPAFSNTTADFPWTSSSGDTYSTALPSQRLRVAVTLWTVVPNLEVEEQKDLEQKALGLIALANEYLRKSFSGIELVANETGPEPPEIVNVYSLTGSDVLAAIIGTGCDKVPDIKTSTVYKADRINVYYMKEVMGGTAKGYNCIAEDAPNIVFWDSDGSDYFTLPHEIGHGLGQTRPDWGHTEQLPGFWSDPELGEYGEAIGELNIMARYATAPDYFSVGQVIRMHAASDSWLNIPVGGSTVRSRQTTPVPVVTLCGCPESDAKADCPRLDADIDRTGGTRIRQIESPPKPMACHVRLEGGSCVELPQVDDTRLVNAKFQKSETDPTEARGEAIVVSLAPAIVSVMKTSEAAGMVTAELTAVKPGRAIVRIFGGGAYAAIEARVGEACP